MASLKQIFKITTLFSGVQGLNILLNLVRTKLAAVILGPAGVGLNSIYNEMRELIHSTTNMGMDISAVREISQAYESGDEKNIEESIMVTRSWVFLLALLGAFICFALSEPLSWLTFNDFEHTWDYALLAPSVAFSTFTCGEMAIIKGTRKIKALAIISIINIIAGIATTIPVYYFFGLEGIIPAIVLLTLTLYIIACCYSYREFPLHINLKTGNLRKGFPMIALGISFVLTGIIGHGMQLASRSYFNAVASIEVVGLYSAGLTLVTTYGGVIFATLDNDFFSRLSGSFSNKEKRIDTLRKQIDVLLMLAVPLVLFMILSLPILVPLLFSSKFDAVIPMAQIASVGLLFRAVYLPTAFMPLSAGDSKSYMVLEIVSYLIVFVCVISGYRLYGLTGTGIGLSIASLVEMLMNLAFIRWRYGTMIRKRQAMILVLSTIIATGLLYIYL